MMKLISIWFSYLLVRVGYLPSVSSNTQKTRIYRKKNNHQKHQNKINKFCVEKKYM